MSPQNAAPATLLSIGHSDHEIPAFVELLRRHQVDVIADVRSQPYSRFHAQFNRETVCEALKQHGIQYLFLGRELGARRSEPEAYAGKQARYDRICKLPLFLAGLDRLRVGASKYRVALMCAEKDPIECHRSVLICRQLRKDALTIQHIGPDGALESTSQLEQRLLALVGLPPTHLFMNQEQLIEEAYDIQSGRIAYTEAEVA